MGKRSGEFVRETERLRKILMSAPYGAYVVDLSGKVMIANQVGTEHLGRPVEDLLNRPLWEYLPDKVAQDWRRKGLRVAKSGKPTRFETKRDDKRYETTISPIQDDQGKVAYLAIYLADKSERKRIDADLGRRQQMANVLESIADAFLAIDQEWRFTYVSQRTQVLLGRAAEDLIGKSIWSVLPEGIGRLLRPACEEAISKQSPVQLEKYYPAWRRWFENRIYPLPEGLAICLQDITERRRTERALRQREQGILSTINAFSDMVHVADRDLRIVLFNEAFRQRLSESGISCNPEGRNLFELIPSLPAAVRNEYESVLQTGKVLVTEELTQINQKTYWTEARKIPILDENGKVYRIATVIHDITERKQAEERLRYHLELEKQVGSISNMFLHLAPEQIDRGIKSVLRMIGEFAAVDRSHLFLLSEDGQWIESTHEWCAEGIEPIIDNLKSLPAQAFPWWMERIHRLETIDIPRVADLPPEAGAEKPILQAHDVQSLLVVPMVSGNRPIGFLGFDSVQSERRWTEEDSAFLKVVAQVLANALARKQAEEALRQSEARYRSLIEQLADGIYLLDTETKRVLQSNLAFQEMLGYSSEELAGMHLYEFIAADREDIDRRFQYVLGLKGAKVFTHERKYRRKDGSLLDVWVRGSSISSYGGKEVMCTLVRDITDRKRAEEALGESEARYRAVVEQSPDAIYLVEAESGRIFEANSAFQSLLGYTLKEVRALSVYDVVAAQRKDIAARLEKVIRASGPVSFERQLRRKDGSIIDVWVSAKVISYRDKQAVCALARDLTERKRMEEALLKAEKLESLGILAGGIAHDFNNLLTSILSNLSLARLSASEASMEKLKPRLSDAERACLRAQELTHQLLTFSKGRAPIRKATSLPYLLRGSAQFALSGSKVVCQFSLPEDLWAAEIDEGQISQVIHNLVLNACHAMPGGGKIQVRAQNLTLEEPCPLPLASGEYVQVSVIDHGIGIPREHLTRIFDPFFTTKQKGSGLGLFTSYSILKNHGGYLTAESELGKGATFTLYLPASSQQVEAPEAAQETPIHGKGKILVMDDEEGVRASAREVLIYLGYEVTLATDGAEAIQLYQEAKESGEPFTAVILDLTVPGGIGGQRAVGRLIEMDPQVKAIVSSGYSEDPIMANFQEYGFSGILSKPYKIEQLGQILQEVIRGGMAVRS